MCQVLDNLTGRQVASLILCARYSGPSASYGFSSGTCGPALECIGAVELSGFGYRATAYGRKLVAGLGYYDQYAADAMGDLPYGRRSGYEHAIKSAYVAPFAEAREIIARNVAG